MDVTVSPTQFAGVLVLRPDCFEDARGFFTETYHQKKLRHRGLDLSFVQDNHSRSHRGVLRGFHYQDARAPQVRLVRCTVGEIFDVIVDLKVGSPTFGKYFGIRLSAEDRQQLLVPAEFAHAFVVLSHVAEVQYKCTNHHDPTAERSLLWNDPDIAVKWPVDDPILSDRDREAPSLKDYLKQPAFGGAPATAGQESAAMRS